MEQEGTSPGVPPTPAPEQAAELEAVPAPAPTPAVRAEPVTAVAVPKSPAKNPPARWVLTQEQREKMVAYYTKSKFPEAQDIDKYAQELGVTSRQIQVWFQNRRQREANIRMDAYRNVASALNMANNVSTTIVNMNAAAQQHWQHAAMMGLPGMAPVIPPHLLQVPQVPQMPQMLQAMPACAACAYSLQATPGAGPMPSSATQVYPYHSMPGSVPIQPPAVEAPCHLTAPPQPAFAGLSQHPTPPLPSTSALSAVHPFEQLASLASATQPAVGASPSSNGAVSLQNTPLFHQAPDSAGQLLVASGWTQRGTSQPNEPQPPSAPVNLNGKRPAEGAKAEWVRMQKSAPST